MPFRVVNGVGQGLDGVVIVEWEGAVWGECWASHGNQWGICCVVVKPVTSHLMTGGFVFLNLWTLSGIHKLRRRGDLALRRSGALTSKLETMG